MSKGLTSGLVLLVLGLVMGLLLAIVNSVTAPIILENENQAKYEAIGEFYDLGAYSIEEIEVTDSIVTTMYVLKQNNEIQAIVYSVTKYGFQSNITLLIAVSNTLIIDGYTVVSQAETAGYGALAPTHDFNMTGVSIVGFSEDNWNVALWKTDSGTTFDGIAGATISSTAINDCFKAVFDRATSDFGGAN